MTSTHFHSGELIRIHLDEGEVADAIELLEARPKKRGVSPVWGRVDLEVAKAAEKSHPDTPLQIYQAEAEGLIAARGRGNYKTACEFLERVKRLLTTTDRRQQWEKYIANLRERNRSLPALKEELSERRL